MEDNDIIEFCKQRMDLDAGYAIAYAILTKAERDHAIRAAPSAIRVRIMEGAIESLIAEGPITTGKDEILERVNASLSKNTKKFSLVEMVRCLNQSNKITCSESRPRNDNGRQRLLSISKIDEDDVL